MKYNIVRAIWFVISYIPGTCPRHGDVYLTPGSMYLVSGSWYQVPRERYKVPFALYLA